MIEQSYVFDTYALFAILDGHKHYQPYLSSGIIINDFILAEFHYNLLKVFGRRRAEKFFDSYAPFSMSLTPDLIKKAMAFRYVNRKRGMSMTDCIGYILAKELGVKFLTGDKEFKNQSNVEYVK